MSVVIELENTKNLKKARSILGAKSNVETLELALERVVEEHAPKGKSPKRAELPESFWDELFAQPMLPHNAGSQAVIDERNEARY